jgi:hypothetical protein
LNHEGTKFTKKTRRERRGRRFNTKIQRNEGTKRKAYSEVKRGRGEESYNEAINIEAHG